jgi:hypothetical protein
MKKTCFLSILAFLLCWSCAKNIAGTGSETDTGCAIAGLIQFADSTPVSGADVILHDQSQLTRLTLSKRLANPALIRSGSTKTNINGFFRIDSVDTGGYLVEINDHDSLGAVLPTQINPGDTLKKVNGILQKLGTIIGKLDTTGIGRTNADSIYLPELGRKVGIDSAGNFVITDLPVWNYQIRLAIRDTVVKLPNDSIPVPVKAADTTRIISFGSKSGSVLIDGKVIENPNP